MRLGYFNLLPLAALAGCAALGSGVPAGSMQPAASLRSTASHNKWTTKKSIPTAVLCPGAASIGTKVYVVGGVDSALAVVGTNQIYDTTTDKWSSGKAMPTARWCPGAAVVKGILYEIGGYTTTGGGETDVVEAYDPVHDSWSEKATLPIADAPVASEDANLIYAVGGYGGSGRLANVYRYNPATNVWTTRQPLILGVSNPGIGTIGNDVVVADGLANSGATTETETYSPKTNRWKRMEPDLTGRNAGCSGVVSGKLYLAGGELGAGSAPDTNVLDAYDLQSNRWASEANMPQATVAPGYAAVGGLVYCFSGASSGDPNGATFYSDTQVYQP